MDWQNLLRDIITYLTANFPSFVAILTCVINVYKNVGGFKGAVESLKKQHEESNSELIKTLNEQYGDVVKQFSEKVYEISEKTDKAISVMMETIGTIDKKVDGELTSVNYSVNSLETNVKDALLSVLSEQKKYTQQIGYVIRENEKLRKVLATIITNDKNYLDNGLMKPLLDELNDGVNYGQTEEI